MPSVKGSSSLSIRKKNEVICMSTDEFTLQELLMYALPVVAIASFPDDNSI